MQHAILRLNMYIKHIFVIILAPGALYIVYTIYSAPIYSIYYILYSILSIIYQNIAYFYIYLCTFIEYVHIKVAVLTLTS